VAELVLLGDGAGGADEVDGAIAVAGPVVLEEDLDGPRDRAPE
jgi:hypothetical protein